ncbi:MAG TPA: hypothetical protein VHK24_03395, partial [Steroidobacter sp.]|nr:hypothetical protein [Steroidobacter sp.]
EEDLMRIQREIEGQTPTFELAHKRPAETRLKARTIALATVATLTLVGCEQPSSSESAPVQSRAAQPSPARVGPNDGALPDFVGKVWVSTTLGRARGIKVFLPNKTLLLASCSQGYRLVEWGVVSDDTIRWREDAVPIEAQFVEPTKEVLRLRITGADQEETYIAADVPYACPQTPR